MMTPTLTCRRPWNKDLSVGQKKAFSRDDVRQIENALLEESNWHDLALLGFGIDTMFRAGDLLSTQVWHVTFPNGHIRTMIPRQQQKTKSNVSPVLTEPTRKYLKRWLELSGKAPEDFVFTRTKSSSSPPLTRSYYAELVKTWADWCGHAPEEFSTHSVRRSKPAHMYWEGEDIALISRLLGHKSIAVTIEYLGITQAKAEAAALRYPMMCGMPKNK